MSNRQIVITSDRPVTALKLLEERISSRLSGGLVADIQPPDLETPPRHPARQSRGHARSHTPRRPRPARRAHLPNIRELEGSLNRVVAYAQLTGRP